ncbi:hypothetical protein A9Q81_02885 [Gammaproteobacteria bacterium 42_54_T18]|nr:hypothetical protein A9Q81_02885 [Gammaproteobacteria bacterium 42_54_T18]
MKLKRIDLSLEYVNTAEAKFGDIVLLNDTLVIPYFNVYISSGGKNIASPSIRESYIELSYLVFRNINVITWDYDSSRIIDSKNRVCYGGIHYFSDDYKEFWLSCEESAIYVPMEIAASNSPFPERDEVLKDFFHVSKVLETDFYK